MNSLQTISELGGKLTEVSKVLLAAVYIAAWDPLRSGGLVHHFKVMQSQRAPNRFFKKKINVSRAMEEE